MSAGVKLFNAHGPYRRDSSGPYEILAPIGAGGMGEVYRARDTQLDRDVAIKVLPAALAQDPERLARFESEAKVPASAPRLTTFTSPASTVVAKFKSNSWPAEDHSELSVGYRKASMLGGTRAETRRPAPGCRRYFPAATSRVHEMAQQLESGGKAQQMSDAGRKWVREENEHEGRLTNL
jgi:serine/threonine protein kinase